jgi:hypothetical protein
VALGGGWLLAIFDIFCVCVTCRSLLLSYVKSKCLFRQKVIYEKIVEQLSELPPRFFLKIKKKNAWFHPACPDNNRYVPGEFTQINF